MRDFGELHRALVITGRHLREARTETLLLRRRGRLRGCLRALLRPPRGDSLRPDCQELPGILLPASHPEPCPRLSGCGHSRLLQLAWTERVLLLEPHLHAPPQPQYLVRRRHDSEPLLQVLGG